MKLAVAKYLSIVLTKKKLQIKNLQILKSDLMNHIPTVQIRNMKLPDDIELVRKLWTDYLTWGNETMQINYGVHPHNPKKIVEQDIKEIDRYLPPNGKVFLAFIENKVCGIGCLNNLGKEVGELKRMFVDPSFRKLGIGKAILQSVINAAKEAGHKKLRLNTPKFMETAHSLYLGFGFKPISAYSEVEITEDYREYLLFMELDLLRCT